MGLTHFSLTSNLYIFMTSITPVPSGKECFGVNYGWLRSAGDGEIGLNSCHSQLLSGLMNTHTHTQLWHHENRKDSNPC